MKTSKQDKKDNPTKFSIFIENFKSKLDLKPSQTGIMLAIILVLSFAFSILRFYTAWNKPVVVQETDKSFTEKLLQQFNARDSVGLVDRITDMLILLELQNEIEAMQRDSTKIDSLRLEQIEQLLNTYTQ